ncbi:acidic repeat-containing protein [Thrips palmi]|uniref:Acidic repeat-containing protein n=1 Tax=Thrips palmi TaxID=161013 RepID=A0A6P8Y6P7_THRPL|nr:acidic repeat-containing protein [Thrips palmi]
MHAAGPLGAGAPAVEEEEVSDYTDADESISAPTEFLAEFLSAIMGKDYPTALKYCKLILQYEPNNRTAREFYPLIVEKLVQSTIDEARTDSEDDSSSGGSGSLTGSGSDDEDSSSDLSEDEDDGDDEDDGLEPRRGQEHNDNSSVEYGDTDGTTASYSSLEDEEADPADSTDTTGMANDNEDVENGNQEHLQVPYVPYDSHDAQLANKVNKLTLTAPATGTTGTAARCSDSESPTEPVSQQLVTELRARVLPAAMLPAPWCLRRPRRRQPARAWLAWPAGDEHEASASITLGASLSQKSNREQIFKNAFLVI